jgi:hypothetical protein
MCLTFVEWVDVQVTMKGSDEEVEKLPWSAHALRNSDSYRSPAANTFPLFKSNPFPYHLFLAQLCQRRFKSEIGH